MKFYPEHIQYNTILPLITSALSITRAESEAQAVASSEDGVAELREGTRKIQCLKMLCKTSM